MTEQTGAYPFFRDVSASSANLQVLSHAIDLDSVADQLLDEAIKRQSETLLQNRKKAVAMRVTVETWYS